MDTYSLLREIADSWVLLGLFAVFAGVVLWAFRPGSRGLHDDAAAVPFRHDVIEAPAAPAAAPCTRSCPGCTCKPLDFLEEYRDV